MMRLCTALLLGLVASCAHARVLLQERCDPQTSTWQFGSCPAALIGGTPPSPSPPPPPPPPPVSASNGPADNSAAPPASPLPPRWGSEAPLSPAPEGNATNTTGNPFVARDTPAPPVMAAQGAGVSGGRTIGFATGGAQDVENFRQNIKEGYLPMPTDITYEGLIKNYTFDTTSNTTQPCTELFCPLYSLGIAPDPLRQAATARRRSLLQNEGGGSGSSSTAPPEVYAAVGLDSGILASEFQRKRLNLGLLLDVSGSMGSPFNRYYYDSITGEPKNLTDQEANMTKIDVAKEVLTGILDLLKPEDSFSITLFSDAACTPKAFGPVSCVDIPSLEAHIMKDVNDTSSTALSAGWDEATAQLKPHAGGNASEVENRIILITDQEPNYGDFTTEGLAARLKSNADAGIFTTIIGVGLDFNTELVEAISKFRGANYFSVHSPGEFKRRLVDEFDYAVTPLVFDLALQVVTSGANGSTSDDSGWRILHVYGSPNPNETALSSDGTVMRVHTLFPSPKTEEGIKGGVVLLRLRPPANGANTPLRLAVTYADQEGKQFRSERTVALPAGFTAAAASSAAAPMSYYQSSGVRKAVLLARYTDMLQGWPIDEWGAIDTNDTVVVNSTLCGVFPADFCPDVDAKSKYGVTPTGNGDCKVNRWLLPDACLLPVPFPLLVQLSEWERTSHNLTVASEAEQAFQAFLPYLQEEMAAVNDPSLQQEVDLLNTLIAV